jgi:hypothetical protein
VLSEIICRGYRADGRPLKGQEFDTIDPSIPASGYRSQSPLRPGGGLPALLRIAVLIPTDGNSAWAPARLLFPECKNDDQRAE